MTFRRQLEIQTRQYLMILRRYYQFKFLRMIMISLFKSICFRNKNWNVYRRNDMVDMVSRIYFQIIEEEEVNLHVDETSWPRTNNCSWVTGIWGFIKLCCLPLYWFAIVHNKKLKSVYSLINPVIQKIQSCMWAQLIYYVFDFLFPSAFLVLDFWNSCFIHFGSIGCILIGFCACSYYVLLFMFFLWLSFWAFI